MTYSEKMNHETALHKIFVDGLKDVLWAEESLIKNLKMMAQGATSVELKEAFNAHTQETAGHIEKLKLVFESLGETPSGKKCPAMEGLINEAKELLESTHESSMVRDAALIAGAQKIEHYEIATYGTLATFAKEMGHKEAKNLLGSILDEEKQADEKLTLLAETIINKAANEEAA